MIVERFLSIMDFEAFCDIMGAADEKEENSLGKF